MGEPHLDHPGEVHWFSGFEPLPVVGPCPHTTCEHFGTEVVAYGPDFEHYELVECTDCWCRGWWGEWDDASGRHYRIPTSWLELERAPAEALP